MEESLSPFNQLFSKDMRGSHLVGVFVPGVAAHKFQRILIQPGLLNLVRPGFQHPLALRGTVQIVRTD